MCVFEKSQFSFSAEESFLTLHLLQQGETPLFLSAVYGCYDTARLLLLHGANLELHDRRGRKATDMAREGLRHQVLELLLTHQMQRGPVTMEPSDMLWDDHGLMYSPWLGSQGLPGRSASFSGIVGHRDMTPPPQRSASLSISWELVTVVFRVYQTTGAPERPVCTAVVSGSTAKPKLDLSLQLELVKFP